MSPAVQAGSTPSDASSGAAIALPSVGMLDDAEISGNHFVGMTIASLIMAQLGLIRCMDNRVVESCAGFWFISSELGPNVEFGRAALAAEKKGGADAALAYTVRQGIQSLALAHIVQYAGKMQFPVSTASVAPSSLTISHEVMTVLLADFGTRGGGAFGNSTQQPSTAPSAATTGQEAAPQQAAGTAAGSSTPELSETTYNQTVAAYGTLETVGLAAETLGTTLEPVLALRNNDIVLVPQVLAAGDSTAAGLPALPGIFTMLEQGSETGAVFISGNRVYVPNGSSIAAVALWGADTLITGNLFKQISLGKGELPCAIFIRDANSQSVLMANLVQLRWFNLPARQVPAAIATNTWEFLNTLG